MIERLCRSVGGVVSVDQPLGHTHGDLAADPDTPAIVATGEPPLHARAERAHPLLADPDCAVHGRQPLLRILVRTLSVNFMKAPRVAGHHRPVGLVRVCRSVDGVINVANRLTYEQDDMSVDAQEAAGR
ncbi:hypothetical protein [Streptomyces sp. NPDC057582]|uniref:hypothetical protein n=1 Tax=unclassified Streptomyces TaxID=2593676 RepID=UPI0036A3328C